MNRMRIIAVGLVLGWTSGLGPPEAIGGAGDFVVFRRVAEPRENAFSMLIPQGWTVEGGIVRVDPGLAGGPAQSIEAKVDFQAGKDTAGSVMFHRFPDWYYCDMRYSPAGQMGLFPTGSNYAGMTVCPLLSPEQFLTELLIPRIHPGCRNLKVLDRQPVPHLVGQYRQRLAAMVVPLNFDFQGAILTLSYEEGGVTYREKVITLVENRGPLVGGQWANRETLSYRAPAAEFASWEPVFLVMFGSVQLNARWLSEEIRNQAIRAGIWQEVQGRIQELDRQILAHKQETNAEIQNDMFLTLTGQEEYVNPYTQQTEVGTDQLGQNRWVTEGGDVVYAATEDFDPNVGGVLNRSDWKRSPVRPR